MARLDGTPPDRKEDFEDFIVHLKEGGDFKIVEKQVSGRCAVVVVYDNPKPGKKIDIDPFYLVEQAGQWKIMPDFTSWELATFIAKDTVADFEKLEKHYKARKAEIYAEIEN